MIDQGPLRLDTQTPVWTCTDPPPFMLSAWYSLCSLPRALVKPRAPGARSHARSSTSDPALHAGTHWPILLTRPPARCSRVCGCQLQLAQLCHGKECVHVRTACSRPRSNVSRHLLLRLLLAVPSRLLASVKRVATHPATAFTCCPSSAVPPGLCAWL